MSDPIPLKVVPRDQSTATVPMRKFDGERHRANRERDARRAAELELQAARDQLAAMRAITVRVLRAYYTLTQDRRQRFEDAGFASPEMFLDAMMADLDPHAIRSALESLFGEFGRN